MQRPGERLFVQLLTNSQFAKGADRGTQHIMPPGTRSTQDSINLSVVPFPHNTLFCLHIAYSLKLTTHGACSWVLGSALSAACKADKGPHTATYSLVSRNNTRKHVETGTFFVLQQFSFNTVHKTTHKGKAPHHAQDLQPANTTDQQTPGFYHGAKQDQRIPQNLNRMC